MIQYLDFFACFPSQTDGVPNEEDSDLLFVSEHKKNCSNSSVFKCIGQLLGAQEASVFSRAGSRFFVACYPSDPGETARRLHGKYGQDVWWPELGTDAEWVGEVKRIVEGAF